MKVKIGPGWHSVVLDGPLPSVKIGAQRPDLCRGRVFLLVDGDVEHRIPLYLDRKPQLAEVRARLIFTINVPLKARFSDQDPQFWSPWIQIRILIRIQSSF